MTERAKAFVAVVGKAVHTDTLERRYRRLYYEEVYPEEDACVVTPLQEGDPRPEEVWEYHGKDVTIGSVYYDHQYGRMYANTPETGDVCFSDLRPKPTLKTYRLTTFPSIQAESKEAALAKLADALEEV